MNRERLFELRSMMEGIPDTQVDLQVWVRVGCTAEEGYLTVEKHQCGAIACALGFAAQYPPFVEQGLTLSKNLMEPMISVDTEFGPDILRGFEAAVHFFGLNHVQARQLFCPFNRTRGELRSDKTVFLQRLDYLLNEGDLP